MSRRWKVTGHKVESMSLPAPFQRAPPAHRNPRATEGSGIWDGDSTSLEPRVRCVVRNGLVLASQAQAEAAECCAKALHPPSLSWQIVIALKIPHAQCDAPFCFFVSEPDARSNGPKLAAEPYSRPTESIQRPTAEALVR
ncbi:hypothetical protein IF1G_05165 [Cordyceps javanica]|uniref:Uncharacterized protein n=1 Tax=Cordyceps javanica TaxID=43265 RepID=A0A545V4E2_9HYPO|nr:hypothetical protein IF1G_05165 [Cordyceps javanica]